MKYYTTASPKAPNTTKPVVTNKTTTPETQKQLSARPSFLEQKPLPQDNTKPLNKPPSN